MDAQRQLRADVRRLRERLRELEAYADRARLSPSLLSIGAVQNGSPVAVKVGDFWPERHHPARIEVTFDVPSTWPKDVELWADLGGEGLWLDGGSAKFGFNPMHRSACVQVQPGASASFAFDVVPHGYQGAPVHEPRINMCRLVAVEPSVRALVFDLSIALDVLDFLAREQDFEVAVRLRAKVEKALRALELPREPSAAYLARMAWLEATPVEGGSPDSPSLQVRSTLWERPRFESAPLELDDDARERISRIREQFGQDCRALRARYPGRGRLVLLGHAHLDIAWLWPISETRHKSRRTFATACALADRYPDYVFGQSQAYLYACVEEDDPALFSRIAAHVASEQFELLGGSWVEPDGNLAGGESTVRQLLYGQTYFESRFGKRCSVAWLPDTFGYAGNLPQLYASAGMHAFVTTKLNWNETNTFPHDLYLWEGLDGTRILAHTFKDLGPGADPQIMRNAWREYRANVRADVAIQTYGRGDGGGGPNEHMVEGFARLAQHPVLPSMRFGRLVEVMDALRQVEELPVWKGEKYLEKHRGTFTSQAVIKRDVQRLGEALRATETLWTMAWAEAGAPYPKDRLEALWKTLLVHEFHDILPGSSIHTVNEEAKRDLAEALAATEALLGEAHVALAKQAALAKHVALAKAEAQIEAHADERVQLWNLGETDLPLAGSIVASTELDIGAIGTLRTTKGEPLRTQRVGDELLFSGNARVRPNEACTLSLSTSSDANDDKAQLPFEQVTASASSLRSDCLDVTFAADGTIASLRSIATGREFVAPGAGQFMLHEDVPREYEAWDIDQQDLLHAAPLRVVGEPVVLYQGPVEAALRFQLSGSGVDVELTYKLRAGSARLDARARVDWRGRRQLLRLVVPTAISADTARYDTLFGSVSRPTHQNTSWDAAKYEVPAHRGATLEDARGGLQLIAPYGRHGFSATGNTLGLSLLRAPIHPDPQADEGVHNFEYAIAVFDASPVPPPVRGALSARKGPPPAFVSERPWFEHEGVRCTAVKKCESRDAVAVRLYEADGVAREVVVAVPAWVRSAELATILEEPIESLLLVEPGTDQAHVRVRFSPYGVRTIVVSSEALLA